MNSQKKEINEIMLPLKKKITEKRAITKTTKLLNIGKRSNNNYKRSLIICIKQIDNNEKKP